MTTKPPVEFRIGDRVRLRKVHPCGGWTWKVVRLGADIGLVCETCGRRVLLDRPTLERRVKSFLEHGPASSDDRTRANQEGSDGGPAGFSCDLLGLQPGDILEATTDLDVVVAFFYTTSSDTGRGLIRRGDRVRVPSAPTPGSNTALVEPVDTRNFEQRFVPGGIRSQGSYTGYAIVAGCGDLARSFKLVSREESGVASGEPMDLC